MSTFAQAQQQYLQQNQNMQGYAQNLSSYPNSGLAQQTYQGESSAKHSREAERQLKEADEKQLLELLFTVRKLINGQETPFTETMRTFAIDLQTYVANGWSVKKVENYLGVENEKR